METLKQKVTIPADHHLTFDVQLPDSIPSGQAEVVLIFQSATGGAETKKPRTPGLLTGKGFYMAEDFDAPLSDEFWVGEADE